MNYIPPQDALLPIAEALRGWPSQQDILAPCYYPSPRVINGMIQFLESQKPLPRKINEEFCEQKAIAVNTLAIILNNPIRPHSYFLPDVKEFVTRTNTEYQAMKLFLEGAIPGFSQVGHPFLGQFIAITAPLLFYLGFTDAIAHSSQVARRCVTEARKRRNHPLEVLQSFMTGWLHDPKLARGSSWSNIASHPLVASAIAFDLSQTPSFQETLEPLVQELNDSKLSMSSQELMQGVAEALSINNDSRFVLENVILHKPKFHGIESDPGLADVIPEIKPLLLDRFEAPSKGVPPAPLPDKLNDALQHLPFETGIKGIYRPYLLEVISGLQQEFPHLQRMQPLELFRQMQVGILYDPPLLYRLSTALRNNPESLLDCHISALYLLSHHDEVIHGKNAAWSLAVSDPLLLSPHKLLVEGNSSENNALSRLYSFIQSFSDNIRWLPKAAQESGKQWQRDVYFSILRAAEILTHGEHLKTYHQLQHHMEDETGHPLELDQSLRLLERILLDSTTWLNETLRVDYTHVEPGDPEFYRLYHTLETCYHEALEQSPEMFGEPMASDQWSEVPSN